MSFAGLTVEILAVTTSGAALPFDESPYSTDLTYMIGALQHRLFAEYSDLFQHCDHGVEKGSATRGRTEYNRAPGRMGLRRYRMIIKDVRRFDPCVKDSDTA